MGVLARDAMVLAYVVVPLYSMLALNTYEWNTTLNALKHLTPKNKATQKLK